MPIHVDFHLFKIAHFMKINPGIYMSLQWFDLFRTSAFEFRKGEKYRTNYRSSPQMQDNVLAKVDVSWCRHTQFCR